MDFVLNFGYYVYCDSFFLFFDLFLKFWNEGIVVCGIVKLNRKGMLKDLDKIKLKN